MPDPMLERYDDPGAGLGVSGPITATIGGAGDPPQAAAAVVVGSTAPALGSSSFPTPLPLVEGQVLGDTYRIVRLIGEGGMGVVYEATHARLAGRYAVKVLLHGLSDNVEALARFNREARITSSLQHPNIVQVIDFNRLADGTEYLVMEYLQGETLGDRLLRLGALPADYVVGIVQQIAAGLAAAHALSVVHRDLKPENIFLLPVAGREIELAKVLDFGISKMSNVSRGFQGPQSTQMGTPQYMSPEQCRGRAAEVDAISDQFSLAVMTYEMLTGRRPFVGDNLGTVLTQVLHEEPPPMGVDPELERVVRRGMAKSRAARYPSVVAFAEALGAAAARAPVSPRPPAAVAREEAASPDLRPRSRKRILVPLALAAATVGIFFVVGGTEARWLATFHVPGSATAHLPDSAAAPANGLRPGERQPVVAQTPSAVVPRPPAGPAEAASANPPEPSPLAKPAEAKGSAEETVERAPGEDRVDPPVTPGAASRRIARAVRRAAGARAGWASAPQAPPPSRTPRPPSVRPIIAPDENATLPLDDSLGDARAP